MTETPPPRVAAFFDVDNTLLRGSSLYFFGKYAVKVGFISWRRLWSFALDQAKFMRFGENLETLSQVRDRAQELAAGHSEQELRRIAREAFERKIRPRLYERAIRRIREHLVRGHEVWLVSAAPVEICDELVHALGLTGALGTVPERKDGVYTGRIEGEFLHGPQKAQAVRDLAQQRGIDLTRSYAYSDSINDEPMLETVGIPVAVNPDRKLRQIARQRGWALESFRR